jgi:hypothetical protein
VEVVVVRKDVQSTKRTSCHDLFIRERIEEAEVSEKVCDANTKEGGEEKGKRSCVQRTKVLGVLRGKAKEM